MAIVLLTIGCEPETLVEKELILIGKIDKVLILGNSITITKPAPEIGWSGDWGMAATEEGNDYVHILINRFQQYSDSVEVRYASISNFERKFWNYDYSQLNGFRDFAPDLLIIRLGENVDDTEAGSRRFDNYLQKLILYITDGRPTAVLCTSTFWPRDATNLLMKSLADRENYIYVPIVDLFSDRTNTARDQFADPGVRIHPSDKGMRSIADRIADKLGIF